MLNMLNELHDAELHGVLERAPRRYVRAELLVIDDFAVLAMDPAQAKLAFQVKQFARQRVGPWVPAMPLIMGPSETGGDTVMSLLWV